MSQENMEKVFYYTGIFTWIIVGIISVYAIIEYLYFKFFIHFVLRKTHVQISKRFAIIWSDKISKKDGGFIEIENVVKKGKFKLVNLFGLKFLY